MATEEAPTVNTSSGEQLAVVGAGASGLGAAIAAAFAGLCCIGPAGVALLGVGGTLAAASLKPYRPILLLGSLALLAFGFWRTYGRRVMVNGASCPIRVGRFARTVLWVSAIIWIVAAILPTS
jgi:hypothetical protein